MYVCVLYSGGPSMDNGAVIRYADKHGDRHQHMNGSNISQTSSGSSGRQTAPNVESGVLRRTAETNNDGTINRQVWI